MVRKETAEQRMDKELGARLVAARKSKGRTQKDMADFFGITPQAWQNYEYGREMKSSMLIKVCATLECSPSWLLGMKETGQQLPPESPLLIALKEAFNGMNEKGQKKVVDYAEDMSRLTEYKVKVKSGVQNSDLPRASGE